MKTCLICNNTFNRNSNITEGSPCPTYACNGSVVDLDDNIFHAIKVLNRKKFLTEESCAGHTQGGDLFIIFDECIHSGAFTKIPKALKSDRTADGRLRIFMKLRSLDPLERQRSIMKASLNLIEWSENLPIARAVMVNFIESTDMSTENIKVLVEKELKLCLAGKFHDGESKIWLGYINYISSERVLEFTAAIKSFALKHNIKVIVGDTNC